MTAKDIAPASHPISPFRKGARLPAVRDWMRKNLFSSPSSAAITLFLFVILALTLPRLFSWALLDATWFGDERDDCAPGGACWAVVTTRWRQFLYGFYPLAERWRVDLTAVLFVIALFYVLYDRAPKRRIGLIFAGLFPLIGFALLTGGGIWPPVRTGLWGGLLLSCVIGFVGIFASLPLGVCLALGRRSQMPVIRLFCITFIEVSRSVPFITVLFMASFLFPLFMPEGVNFDKLLRALVGITIFSAAYLAEVIRGGLQSIPKGQYESATALNLSYWQSMRAVILPQAFRISIPGIINSSIALYKDTSLVLIIGLFDFLGIVKASLTNAKWQGLTAEVYLFAACVYFIICFSMSRYSFYLEKRLGTGRTGD